MQTHSCVAPALIFCSVYGVDDDLALRMADILDQDDTKTGIIVASYCLGALGGCILNFFIGDNLGRRKMIWLAMVRSISDFFSSLSQMS